MEGIKNILLQILEGINYIHCQKFMHRDIKAANLLLDHKGVLKIADFGLARNYYGAPPNLKYPGGAGVDAKYTSVVVTRWYRAPELVLGDKHYTTAVDMWGVGCVFGELFEKKPILQGQTDIDQGHVIFKLLGTPSEEEWPLARFLPGAELTRTKYSPNIRERFGEYLTDTGLDLLSQLLCLDPYKRLTAMAAKKHPFFTEEPLPEPILQLPCEECHEADIKRYKQEQNRSMSQQPPPAPSGHVAEKALPPTSQIPTAPKAALGTIKKPPTGPRSLNENKRGLSSSVHHPSPHAPPSKIAKHASHTEQPRVSRYAGTSHPHNNPASSTASRTDTRYNNIPRKRFYNGPAASNMPETPRTNSYTSRYGQSRGGYSRSSQYPSDARYSNGRFSGTENPNETPLPPPKNDGARNTVPSRSSSLNGNTRAGPENSNSNSRQTRQTTKSNQDMANLY